MVPTADGTLTLERAGSVAAVGRLIRHRRGWDLEVTGHPGVTIEPDEQHDLLTGLVGQATKEGGGLMRWLVRDPDAGDDASARGAGFDGIRDIRQLRRPLPLGPAERAGVPALATRPFRPGVDEAPWIEVNNRSFASHPDQGGQSAADLRALIDEPWFDPDGFLLLDADPTSSRAGQLDGFCWTKVHADHDPPLGEIFVIGVDPSAGGRGLGRALTIAGLDHLHQHGQTVGMLYVDLDNVVAVAMYERLGFTLFHLDRMYLRQG